MIDAKAYFYAAHSSSIPPEKHMADALSALFESFIQWIRDCFTSAPKLTPERVNVVFTDNSHLGLESSTKREEGQPKTVIKEEKRVLQAPHLPLVKLSDNDFDPVAAQQYYTARNSASLIRNRWITYTTTCLTEPGYAKGWAEIEAADEIIKSMEKQQTKPWWE